MFIYPPNKIGDRIIYKLSDYKLTAVVKNYDSKSLPMDKDRLVLLSFLVKKYLREFGNNWKLITRFIEINPCFSKYFITPEIVQEIYQLVQRYEKNNVYIEDI
jgi:hypothetical protein